MWGIESVNKDTYNCFQYIVATMSKFFNCNYQMVMLELWGFKYNNKYNGNIGNKLDLCWNSEINRRRELLSRYHGLQFTITAFTDEDILETINQKLAAAPLAVYLDSYECWWLPFYRKQHRPHTVILTHKRSEKYAFIDQYNDNDKNSEIEFLFVKNHCKEMVEFNYKQVSVDKNEYLLELNRCIDIFEGKNTLEQILNFSCDMKTELKIDNEITDNDPVASKLVMFLKSLAEDRSNLIEAMSYIESKTGVSSGGVKESLYRVSQKYEKLRAYIIKCAFTNRNPDVYKISGEVDGIIDLEKDILSAFKSVCR